MRRKLIKIAYDGSEFNGWQSQKQGRTIQQTIEAVLFNIAKSRVPVVAAGRTDAGVHATGQHAHFDFPLEMNNSQILLAINSGLPIEIRIQEVRDVSEDFHARFNARKRIYKYYIVRKITPFNRKYRSFLPKYRLDPDKIRKAISQFLGKHDFSSFSKANPDNKTTICTVSDFFLEIRDEELQFTISADRFLHNMVRRLIGTVINVTSRDIDNKILLEILETKDPANQLIYTAPPQGLFLADVIY